ncbi:2,4-dienoyl-CoA reductase [Sporomusaceae bacterium FL31]|nr:2,4-dienoyl-CoA reductase [Sporomusaceae bacterium FL31]GCE34416.1 2,4-dienoyl-CoA reductase [Sporomusaceae bacterium]
MAYLLKPLQSDLLSLHNRLVMPPMATAKSDSDGKVSSAILDFYQEKSAGGQLALVIVEHSFVQQSGKASANQLSVADDSVIAGLEQLANVLHRNGVKAVMQINHAGSATSAEITGTNPVGPSAIANPRKGGVPHELTQQEIYDLVTAFRNAASRVKAAGFDGVEIHSAHGYLLNQFFSPLTNQRTDDYGGSVEARIRIHLQVIEAVRQAVGPDYPILLRLGAADFVEGGSTIQDSQIAAREFEKAGINMLDISGGFSGYINPDNNQPGYFSSLSAAIKEVVSIPVILTGGITTAQAAEELLAAGKADLIGVGRAILQDSQWVKNAIAGIQS